MLVSLDLLVRLNACSEQRDVFSSTFPDGLDVVGDPPPETIAKIVAAGLPVAWLAERCLTAAARAEYARAVATADAEYDRVRATAVWRLLSVPANIRSF